MTGKWKLKETTVAVRDEKVQIRELTHGQRLQWIKSAQEERFRGPAILVSMGAIEPKFTEEQVNELPIDVVTELAEAIMKISGMETKKKELDARGAVPVSAGSSAGDSAK